MIYHSHIVDKIVARNEKLEAEKRDLVEANERCRIEIERLRAALQTILVSYDMPNTVRGTARAALGVG